MKETTEREILARVLAKIRRRIFITTACHWMARIALPGLPLCAVLIAADQRWNHGANSYGYLGLTTFGILLASAILSWRALGLRVHSALTFDEQAQLKDRLSSALEFLDQPQLGEAQQVQVRDAIRRAEALDCKKVLRFRWPRLAGALPVGVLLLGLSFLMPSIQPAYAIVAKDATKLAQLRQLEELKQEIQAKQNLPKELTEVLKQLEELKKQFEKGEMGEREVILQLGRLDESLRAKVAEMGVENLEAEISQMIPHLSASAATMDAAKDLQAKDLDKASLDLKDLAAQVNDDKLSKEEKKQLAAHLGAAAAKLGKKPGGDSFSGDLAQASEALESQDNDGFASAVKGMSDKLGMLKKAQGMKLTANQIGLSKSGLGQSDSNSNSNSSELGYKTGQQTLSKNKGGLKAGTATAGDPLADPSRLADGLKKMLQISGQLGQGPRATETEVTDGQMSQSQVGAKEIHATFAAVAEEVIEKEDVPLSQRYHVKRYFQAIRPAE